MQSLSHINLESSSYSHWVILIWSPHHTVIQSYKYGVLIIQLNDCMLLTPDEYDWIDANGWFRLQIKMTEWLYDANFTWIWLNVCMMPTSDLYDWMTVFCQPRLIWLNDCMMSINMTEWLYEANLDWLYDDIILVSFPVLWYPHDHVILLFLQSYVYSLLV
jgi:hypothetical protein